MPASSPKPSASAPDATTLDAVRPDAPPPDAEAPVAIVGAGPVGLALAVGLARHGVRSLLLEQKEGTSRTSKAPALHVRTREIFRQWRIEQPFLEAGELLQTVTLHSVVPGDQPLFELDFTELEPEARSPGLLILEQNRIEDLLLAAARESGLCEVRFGAEAIRLQQDEEFARLTLLEKGAERSVRARYVVGCDGASSFVREALGLPFEGITYSLGPMLADVRVDDERNDLPFPRAWNGEKRLAFAVRLPGGLWRLVSLDRVEPSDERSVPESEVLALAGTLLGPGHAEVAWSSRFRIHLRSSPAFRRGRVLLAGDAAHVHSPASGFGMNGGIQDAHNLAWKLAAALRGGDEGRLLDSYDVERRAVIVEDVSRYTDRITRIFLASPQALRKAAFVALRAAQRIGFSRRRTLRRTAMLDLRYPGSPILNRRERSAGMRLPDVELLAPAGEMVRLYDLLPPGPAMLVLSDAIGAGDGLPVEHIIRIGAGGYRDTSGAIQALLGGSGGWILIRPDMHIAWARYRRDGNDAAVRHALGRDG